MNTTHPIYDLARAAGKAGKDYCLWLERDEEVAPMLNDMTGYDPDSVYAAFLEGVRSSWQDAWTTAPEAYDGFGTATVESHPGFHGKVLRRVKVDPQFYAWQTGRYGSGCCGAWEEDPRVEEARVRKELAEERAWRDQEEARRREGLAWLATADDARLDLNDNDCHDEWQSRGLRTEDVRAERERRQIAAKIKHNAEAWARSAALVPEGSHLVDPGTPGSRGVYGFVKGRDPGAWRSVKIVLGWPADDPDEAKVVGEGGSGESAGSLLWVAGQVEKGEVRVVLPDSEEARSVPPLAVMRRIGHRDLKRIARVEVGGVPYWVGRAAFGDPMVLDEKGHLARSKRVRDAAHRTVSALAV